MCVKVTHHLLLWSRRLRSDEARGTKRNPGTAEVILKISDHGVFPKYHTPSGSSVDLDIDILLLFFLLS